MKKALLAATAVVAVVLVGTGGYVAFADTGDQTERGTCAGRAYELTVEEDDGGLEASFELQSSAPGETWAVELTQGDAVLLGGERTTDEDAEIDLDAVADGAGSDRFTATATPLSPAAGDACVATLTR